MSKRPYFQFYPADWSADSALKSCSDLARLLWFELMILMHNGSPYGTLTLPNGSKIEPKMIQKMINFESKNVKKIPKLFQELIENGVIKCSKNDVFYSKRMVEDEFKRQQWSERQEKRRKNKKEKCHADVTHDVTPMSPRSSYSSSITSSITKDKGVCITPLPPSEKITHNTPDFEKIPESPTRPEPPPPKQGSLSEKATLEVCRPGEKPMTEEAWIIRDMIQHLKSQRIQLNQMASGLDEFIYVNPRAEKMVRFWLSQPDYARMAALFYAANSPKVVNELVYAVSAIEKDWDGYKKYLLEAREAIARNDRKVEI